MWIKLGRKGMDLIGDFEFLRETQRAMVVKSGKPKTKKWLMDTGCTT